MSIGVGDLMPNKSLNRSNEVSGVANDKHFRMITYGQVWSTMTFPDLSVSEPSHRPAGDATTQLPRAPCRPQLFLRRRQFHPNPHS